MKSMELLKAISAIDDKFIEAALEYKGYRVRAYKQAAAIASIAACACIILFGAFFVVSNFKSPSHPGPSTDGHTSAPVVDATESTTTEPSTDGHTSAPVVDPPKPVSDFVIENGILVSYTGSETEITLPEEVSSIASNTFSSSTNAADITTIHLNSGINSIEEKAFSGLVSLSRVTVPEDNSNFIFRDGVLMATDGSIHFSLTDNNTIDVQTFVETLEQMEGSVDFIGKRTKFVFGELIIIAKNNVSPYDLNEARFTIESFSVFGQTFALSDSKYDSSFSDGVIERNAGLTLLLTDDVFVYAKTRTSCGYYLIITADSIYEYHKPPEIIPGSEEAINNPTWYNESVFGYSIDDNGDLVYVREPQKYTFDQRISNEITYCVGLDEFAREEGYVTFENGVIVHNPTSTYTVSEVMNVYECFAIWHSMYKNYSDELLQIAGIPRVSTLDELISYNKEHYEMAK